jgi:hypothetical protein
MKEPRYKAGEEVYVVQDYKVVKCTIEEIVTKQTRTESSLQYIVSPIMSGDGKKREKAVVEANIVQSFDKAKQAAMQNWETIYVMVKKQLVDLTEDMFNNDNN